MGRIAMMNRDTRDASLLREVYDAKEEVKARAVKFGINDFSASELFVLVAVGRRLNFKVAVDLRSDLGIAHEPIGKVVDRLIMRGYLELRNNLDALGRRVLDVTKLGHAAARGVTDIAISERWNDLPFRQGDILIASARKSGTTWLQMICALLIFQRPDLPAPLKVLSPWVDDKSDESPEREELFARLAAQRHRRFMKTHTDLSGILANPLLTYIVPIRHPLDAAVSFYYHLRLGKKTKQGNINESPFYDQVQPREALLDWIGPDRSIVGMMGDCTLTTAMQHVSAAWARRNEPNVVLVRYEDLFADLEGQMRLLAVRLGITVPEALWPRLVEAATFRQMRAAADRLQPVSDLADPKTFFRSGRPGTGRELLTDSELGRYYERAARLAPADLLDWLHRPGHASVKGGTGTG
jgi:hypothetical protein